MSSQMSLNQSETRHPAMSAALAVSALVLAASLTWLMLQLTFETSVAGWMFAIVLALIFFSEDTISNLARTFTPPPRMRTALDAPRRVRLAHAISYAPLFAFCFVRESATLASGSIEWIGGFGLVFVLMFSASEITAAAARLWCARRA